MKIKLLNILFFLLSPFFLISQNYYESKVIATDREEYDLFGKAVDIYKKTAIIGALQEDASSNQFDNSGAVYIYNKVGVIGNQWQQIAKLLPPNREEGALFGSSVAIFEDFAVVGAPEEDSDEIDTNIINNAGSVYIFHRNLNGDWQFHQKIVASNRNEFHYFGFKVDIFNDHIIVGANGYNLNNQNEIDYSLNYSGAAYIFKKDSNNVWEEKAILLPQDRSNLDNFGSSVSIFNNFAVVGSPNDDEDEDNENTLNSSGSIYVFRLINSGWSLTQKIVAPDRKNNSVFGSSINIDQNVIVVGAPSEKTDPNNNNPITQAGAVYVFNKQLTEDKWEFSQKLVPDERHSGALFGASVDHRYNRMIIGAHGEKFDENNLNELDFSGAAYIYNRTQNMWWQESKLNHYDRTANDHFGIDVSIYEDLAIAGAFNEDENIQGAETINQAGSAYLFRRNYYSIASSEAELFKLTSSDGLMKSSTEEISVFPNPFNNQLNIDGKNIELLSITNSIGEEVFKKRGTNDHSTILNTSHLNPGIYFLKVKNKTDTLVFKIIKN